MAGMEMPAKTHGVGVFLELRKRLQSGLLIVGKDVAGSSTDVVVTGGDSSLCVRMPRSELSPVLPPGVSFEEGSCFPTAAGESCGEELHFRLRISVAQNRNEEASHTVMETLRVKETYCFYCQSCMTRLLEDRLFKRVLPLPNGNWNAIVDDWCCHPDPFANKKLLPRAEDCLLGDTFILLPRDGSCEQTLTQEVTPVGSEDNQDPKKPCRRRTIVSCKSCSSILGEAVAPETLKLYITQVVVEATVGDRKPEASLNRSLFLERTVAARLLELSNSLSTFHFCVQTPDGKAFLLLWLLNSDSIIASVLPETCVGGERSVSSPALHSPSPRAARALKLLYIACSDTGTQQREMKDYFVGEQILGLNRTLCAKVPCPDIIVYYFANEIAIKKPGRVKAVQSFVVSTIFDKPTGWLTEKSIVTSWEVNTIGHPVELPPKVCEELLQVIDDSNSALPASMCCMRSYKVAYLRL